MLSLPKVTVVVPVYNSQETIGACIRSLLELDYPDGKLELIAVDNGSTDATPAILREYRTNLRILHEAKRGPAAARNRGILHARADVIAFTDADCIVDKHWLRHLVRPLKDPDIGVVGGTILARRPCNRIAAFGEAIHDHELAIKTFKPAAVITMNWASRSSVLKEVGLFDEKFIRCEDVDLSYRILQAGYRFDFQREAVVYHRNEETYAGLFQEGVLHGWYGVQTLRKHRDFVREFGHRRLNAASYGAIVSRLLQFVSGADRPSSACFVVFNSGKKLGKIAGSIRFCYLDL